MDSFFLYLLWLVYRLIDWCQTRISAVDSDIKFYDGNGAYNPRIDIDSTSAFWTDCESATYRFNMAIRNRMLFSIFLNSNASVYKCNEWHGRNGNREKGVQQHTIVK